MTTMTTLNGHRPDYQTMLRDLRTEAERVDAAIRAVEALANETPEVHVPGRRGRKSMDPGERAQVSERMTNCWASRRAKGPGAAVSSIAKEMAAATRGTG
jgi:hypothetical protein